MAITEYKIGANHGSLTALSQLTTPVKHHPHRDPIDYSAPTPMGDGTIRNLGWQRTYWHFAGITTAERDQLYTFIGNVNIYMPDNSDSMTEYTALMVWPEREPEHYGGGVLDLTIEFRKLAIYP